MSGSDFLPKREADLVAWSTTFKTLIMASAPGYGLTTQQSTEYGALHDSFVSVRQLCQERSERTPSRIVAKNEAMEALIADARKLARIVQANPNVTNEQRSDLGLTVRDEPSPVPAPSSAPSLTIEWVKGRTVRVRLRDVDNPDRRGKPDHVKGATILTYVGEEPPSVPADWSFYANETRPLFDITFPATIAAGTKVWITSFWFNEKGESGPASPAQSTRFSDGLEEAA